MFGFGFWLAPIPSVLKIESALSSEKLVSTSDITRRQNTKPVSEYFFSTPSL
jgi:hypothetical protein